MSEDSEKKEDAIHRVETVPPPPGEGDAYSAPTTVGPVNEAVIEAMRKAGVREELIPSSRPTPRRDPFSGSNDLVAAAAPQDLPRLYEAEDDEAATVLHPSANKIPLAVPEPRPMPEPPMPAAAPRDPEPRARFGFGRIVALLVIAALALATSVAFVASLR